MRIIFPVLALLAASCVSQKPALVAHGPPVVIEKPADVVEKPIELVPHQPETPPSVCGTLVSAINRGDWAALQVWTKPGTTTNDTITTWQKAAESGHPVKVGKFLNAQTVGGTSQRPYKLYSFSMENKDGTVNPHWLQIKVREEGGNAEIVDFWNFGW